MPDNQMIQTTGHAFKDYDNSLNELLSSISSMGDQVDQMADMLLNALNNDSPISDVQEAKKLDKIVNKFELEVEEEVSEILSKYQPGRQELRFLINAVKIAAALERTGDMAKVAIKQYSKLSNKVPEKTRNSVINMVENVKQILSLSLKNLSSYDDERAKKIASYEERVDDIYLGLHKALVDDVKSDPDRFLTNIGILTVAKTVERMADKVFELLKLEYFIATGRKIRRTDLE